MNQAASATRRPAGSTANTGCCPMFNTTPFFVNTFTPQTAPLIPPPPPAGHCFLGTQAPQIHLPSNQQQQQQSAAAALTLQPPLISQQQQQQQQSQLQQQQSSGAPPLSGSNNIQQQQQQQRQQTQQQPQPSRLQDLSNNYNTSAPITAPGLSLQQLLASRHSASNCMALAAALASASFPHFQQLQQAQQQQQQQQLHQSTPINQSTSTSNSSNPVQSPPSLNATNTPVTNQVPLLNFNSYNSAQPFLSSQALHSTAPAAAHLNTHPNTHLGALNTTTQNIVGNQPTVPQGGLPIANTTSSNLTLEQNQQQQQHRQPLTTNMNNVSNQPTNYRVNATQAPINTMPTAHPNQQLRQVNRNILNDEALNTLLNDQFQTILLNQLFANHQFTPSVTVPAPAPAQQQARVSSNPNRPLQQQQQSTLDQAPVVVSSSQQNAARIVPQQQPSTQEPVSEQQQQQQQQAFQAQPTRMTQVPMADPYVTSNAANSTSNGGYQAQQQQQHTGLVNHHHLQHHQPSAVPEPVPQFQAQQPPQQQAPPASQQQRQQQQQQQPQPIPPMPFYSFPQMEQALALLTNPQVANNIFSHVFNIYFQNGMRTEPLHTHHHHHAPHHFHHHLHGAHHHHHGPNGPANGQDVTMPLDSLAISESKPRGLNRAEIDSLTPYIHMNEKDSRTCVICLSKFELKSKIRPLPCNHAFHAKCVDKWLRANRTCPICRRDALKTYGPKIKRV